MPANERYCAQLIGYFDQFSNWSFISDDTKRQMVDFMARACRDDHEAHAAVQDILENQTTGKVPTIAELRHWIEIQREGVPYQPPAPENGGCGWQSEKEVDSEGKPARCNDGWIHIVRKAVVKGLPTLAEYSYTGKCPRCQNPAWYAKQEGK